MLQNAYLNAADLMAVVDDHGCGRLMLLANWTIGMALGERASLVEVD
ncbi:hypothetical protein [Pyrodictium abyssi]|uniref:Uncharacterized protein n=1 Tax=Pyrodictium abyssi TaxID=54256 RepID=A0ABM8IX90_9CREN|nr:hypothetical protein PABY_03550 [Pyrodictium abyssi]